MRRKKFIQACLLLGLILITFTGLAVHPLLSQSPPVTPVKILSVYGTSSSDDSKPVTDLLDVKREGSWKPKCVDSGVDEGLYFQFTAPVLIDYIEVKFKAKELIHSMLTYYLDGKRNLSRTHQTAPDEEEGVDNGMEYWALLIPQKNINLCRFGARDHGRYDSLQPLNTKVQSLFIKISRVEDLPEIVSVRFYAKNSSNPLPVVVPKYVSGQVTATSTLEPATAYNVLNLFDSQRDFAWATDGKKTTGTGESFTINLDQGLKLSGLMLWNGYQRSTTHYYANSRASKLKITINRQKQFSLDIKDKMEAQTLRFPQTEEVRQLTVTITGIYPGEKYKDMVISDIKLIDAGGDIVILNTHPPAAAPDNQLVKRIMDSSIANFMGWLSQDASNFYYQNTIGDLRLRLRSNHSFVFYYDSETKVMEGNWEEQKGGLRIFGKRYTTNRKDSMYLSSEKEETQAEIFQADVKILDPSQMPFTAVKEYLKTILAERGFYTTEKPDSSSTISWRIDIKDRDEVYLKGSSDEELLKAAYQLAVKHKALLLVSPLFTDLFLPSDRVYYYTAGYEEEVP